MKTSIWQKFLVTVVITGVAASASTTLAQTAASTTTAAVSTPAPQPQLAYGVPQIIQLTQAKISDDTIIAYIKNSGISYNLDANQIIYLRQQGVSDAVITLMLNQPRVGMNNPPPAPYTPPQTAYTPPPAAYNPPADATASTLAPAATTDVAPPVTYVQTVPTTPYYYSSPYYYPSYGYYPGYYYPPVSLSFGWGWGGGWRGGWGGGGWRGGGGFHGGGGFRR